MSVTITLTDPLAEQLCSSQATTSSIGRIRVYSSQERSSACESRHSDP